MANKKNNKQFRETEERMINATIELLQVKSMDALSVREICQVAMVNRSTFYAHFTDKDDLVDHIALALRLELIKAYYP